MVDFYSALSGTLPSQRRESPLYDKMFSEDIDDYTLYDEDTDVDTYEESIDDLYSDIVEDPFTEDYDIDFNAYLDNLMEDIDYYESSDDPTLDSPSNGDITKYIDGLDKASNRNNNNYKLEGSDCHYEMDDDDFDDDDDDDDFELEGYDYSCSNSKGFKSEGKDCYGCGKTEGFDDFDDDEIDTNISKDILNTISGRTLPDYDNYGVDDDDDDFDIDDIAPEDMEFITKIMNSTAVPQMLETCMESDGLADMVQNGEFNTLIEEGILTEDDVKYMGLYTEADDKSYASTPATKIVRYRKIKTLQEQLIGTAVRSIAIHNNDPIQREIERTAALLRKLKGRRYAKYNKQARILVKRYLKALTRTKSPALRRSITIIPTDDNTEKK